MAAPLAAALKPALKAALKLLEKKAIGKAVNFVKRHWKEILCSGLAIQVIIWGTVVAVLLNILSPPGQAQAQSLAATGSVPMPSLADALQDPTRKPFIEAVQRVAGVPLDATSLKVGASAVEQQHWQRMVLLLSMAWVDSRWGTQASAYPIGGTSSVTGTGARAVAQAVVAAGMSPSNINGITMAVAIAGAESGWNPNATHPNANGSADYGLWQINSIHISPPTVPAPPQLFDPVANARAMMLISSNGTNWRPWCTAWSNGACGGVYQGSGAPFQRPGNWGPAQAAALQVSIGAPATGALANAAQFTGVVLMPVAAWAHAPGVSDANNPAQTSAIVTFVDGKLPQGDPQKALTTFYGADPSVAFHVQTILTVDQMSFGHTSPIRQSIVTLASSQRGVMACGRAPLYDTPEVFWCSDAEWCAYFASWVWRQEGIPIPTEAASGAFVGWAQANSTFRPAGSTPLLGDVLVWGSRANPKGEHVSMVVAANGPNSIETIDGNWFVNRKSQVAFRTWYNPNALTDPNALTNGWHVVGYASPVRGA